MMRKTIVRTMATSKINAVCLTVENGQPKVENLDTITVMGKVKENEALKVLKDKLGKNAPVSITSIEVSEDTYEISVEDFVKYATKVDKNENQVEEKTEQAEA